MMAYLWIPTLVTRWYEYLRIPKVFWANFGIASLCLFILILTYNPSMTFREKGGLLMLMSPLCFLILFKIIDIGAIKLFNRPFIMVNRFTLRPGEKYNLYDIIGFLIIVLIPFMLPMALRELEIL